MTSHNITGTSDQPASSAVTRRQWVALVLLSAALALDTGGLALINPALPVIGRDLSMSNATLQWLVTAYAVGFAGFLLFGGRVADVLGRLAHLRGRRRHLHGQRDRGRSGTRRPGPDRGARRAGTRCRPVRSRIPVAGNPAVPGGTAAEPRAGHLHLGRRIQLRRRTGAWRRPDEPARLALGLHLRRDRGSGGAEYRSAMCCRPANGGLRTWICRGRSWSWPRSC